MVHVSTPRPSLGAALGQGFGQGLLSGFDQQKQQRQQQQQQSQLMQALDQAEQLPNISPEQKQNIGLLKALSSRPEIAIELMKRQEESAALNQTREGQNQKQNLLQQIFGGNAPSEQQQEVQQTQPGQPSQAFNPSNLSDAQIAQVTALDPNLGRVLQKQKEKSPEFQRDQQIAKLQSQADVQYNQQLQETSKQHELKEKTLNSLEELNKKGVTGKPYEKLAEKVGLVNLTSEGRREFASGVKNLITDIRSILGSQFSQFEFQTILNAYPSADFSQEANAAIIRNLKYFEDIKSKEGEFGNQLKKENGGKLPFDFQSKVNAKVKEYAQSKLPQIKENTREIMNEQYGIPKGNVLMFDPQGEPLNVSPNDVQRYQSLGATLP
jgi:hypothetical protein